MPTTSPQHDPLLLGDLHVEGKLGEGGMGTVYRVRSQRTGERFAMKVTRFSDWKGQRLFLHELMTWYGLPTYPNLAACRFFRTLENQMVIFAEYVDGGSLAAYIREGRLTRLDQILDIAIQFAWGLHVAHVLGVIHQDVKPGNVLLTSDGLVKVTDFGLARVRIVSALMPDGGTGESVAVTAAIGTPAYFSPEQYDGRALTRKTDIWSWAVSVLEMFLGERTWGKFGTQAPAALEKYLEKGARSRGLPAMPQPVADILRKCFRPDPAERWATLADVRDALITVYCSEVGQEYPRSTPPLSMAEGPAAQDNHRRFGGAQWPDPKDWIGAALAAVGRDKVEMLSLLVAQPSSRRAQVIADLIGYEEAVRLFQDLVKTQGHGPPAQLAAISAELQLGFTTSITPKWQKHTEQLAVLCADKALVHRSVGDSPGGLALYEQTIGIYERLLHQGVHCDLASLALTYQNKAVTLAELGELSAALELYEQAIVLYDRLVYQEGRWDLANDLARTCMNKGCALADLGELGEAVALHEQGIALRERLVYQEGRRELADGLANAYQSKGIALAALGELGAAVELYDRALALFRRLVEQERRWDLANDLARAYQNQAIALAGLGELRAAVALHGQAVGLRVRLVYFEGRRELTRDLAAAYQDHACVLWQLGELGEAVRLFEEGIVLLRWLVYQEARWDLANDLAKAQHNKAAALAGLGELPAAVALHEQAIALRERLVYQEGRWELAGDLAAAYHNKAAALADLGELGTAVELYDQALALFQRLVQQEDRWDLAHPLARSCQSKAIVLRQLGEVREAVALHEQAIALRERLVYQEGRWELAGDLAAAYQSKAIALWQLGEMREAVTLNDQALDVLEPLVHRKGRWDLARSLAATYQTKGIALAALGELGEAVALYDQALALFQQLVHQEGRWDLADPLAATYQNKGVALTNLGELRAAVVVYDQAISLCERMVSEGKGHQLGNLAGAKAGCARALLLLADLERARREAREAVAILRAEVARTRRPDLERLLDWATKELTEVL